VPLLLAEHIIIKGEEEKKSPRNLSLWRPLENVFLSSTVTFRLNELEKTRSSGRRPLVSRTAAGGAAVSAMAMATTTSSLVSK